MTAGVLGMRARNHFGDHGGEFERIHVAGPATATAAAGVAALDAAYTAWHDGIAALGADGMAEPCGPAEGPYSEHPMAALVLHISREVMHHGAEVLCLRDLYRCSGQNRR